MNSSKIFAFLVQQCPLLPLAAPLVGLQPQCRARQGAADPGQLQQTLLEKFPRDALLTAGVLQPKAQGSQELALNPVLTGPMGAFLPLTATAKSDPFELLGAEGCVSGSTLPLLAAVKDFGVKTGVKAGQPLLIAFGVPDCAVLTAAELPCTTANGLARLGDPQLKSVCNKLGWRRGLQLDSVSSTSAMASDSTVSSPFPLRQIVLVGWSPWAWSTEPPAAFAATSAHFQRLHNDLQVQLPQVLLWTPPQSSLESFAVVAEYGSSIEFRQRLLASIKRDAKPLFKIVTKQATLASAYGAVLRPDHKTDAATAQREFLRQIEDRVILPLFARADEGSVQDQLEALLQAVLAEVYFKRTVPLLAEQAHQAPSERSWSTPPGMGLDLTALINMSRELQRWMSASKPKRRK
jgi:hypothetical protein